MCQMDSGGRGGDTESPCFFMVLWEPVVLLQPSDPNQPTALELLVPSPQTQSKLEVGGD